MATNRAHLVLPIILLAFTAGCERAENTVDVPGRSEAFDPVASSPAVAAFAGEDMLLVQMRALYVRPDGTLNLGADYKPKVEYLFFGSGAPPRITPEPKKPDAPLGVPRPDGPQEVIPYWEYVYVYIENPHWEEYTVNGDDALQWYAGMRKEYGREIKDFTEIEKLKTACRALPPLLPLELIWKKAIEAGAPAENAVAIIEYENGRYRFYIDGTDYKYNFDGDGALIEKQ